MTPFVGQTVLHQPAGPSVADAPPQWWPGIVTAVVGADRVDLHVFMSGPRGGHYHVTNVPRGTTPGTWRDIEAIDWDTMLK